MILGIGVCMNQLDLVSPSRITYDELAKFLRMRQQQNILTIAKSDTTAVPLRLQIQLGYAC
jgi:hypothetical protein